MRRRRNLGSAQEFWRFKLSIRTWHAGKRYGRNLLAARYANMHRKGVAELPSGNWPYSKLMGQKEKPPH
jgi:hypothetical protein